MGIIEALRKVVRGLFHRNNIEKAFDIELATSSKMEEALQLWSEMYANEPPWKDLKKGQLTMGLPASIATEVARLVTVEMESEIQGEGPKAEYLQKQYAPVVRRARKVTEYAVAKGGIVLKPYISGERIYVTDVQAEDFFPTTFDSDGEITGGVFVDYSYDEEYRYTRLEEHSLDGTTLTIRNKVFRQKINDITGVDEALGDEVPLTEVEKWSSISPVVRIEGIEKTLFAYYKMPFANNIEPKSPLGVSIYSKAVEQIYEADKQWSEIRWEYKSGERAIHAAETLFKRNDIGEPVLPEGEERLFRTFGFDKDQKLDTFSPEFRDTSLYNGLNEYLRSVEYQCGLAYGTISNPNVEARTATEVKTSQQRSYSTVSDIQKALQAALEHLVYAIDTLATLYDLAPDGEYEVTFQFDDSIITDAEAQRQRDLQEVRDGLMAKWEFRMIWYGEDEETAKRRVAEIGGSQPSDDELMGFLNEPEPGDGSNNPTPPPTEPPVAE